MPQKIFKPAHSSVEDLVPYQTGKPIEEVAREKGLSKIVKLASNENPLGMSDRALEAMRRAAADVNRYPDGGTYVLKKLVADRHGVPDGNIVLGNGSNEILELLTQLLLGNGDETLYAWPAFIVYRLATLAHGSRGVEVPLDKELRHDLGAMRDAITSRTRIVFIANPNNPTGTYVNGTQLEDFIAALPPHVLLVLDEAYFEYAAGLDGFPDGVELFKEGRPIVVTRTFSKAFGLAGLRVGYAVMPEPLVQLINRIRQPFNVNSVAQAAAAAALEDEEFIQRAVQLNRAEMDRLSRALEDIGLMTTPSAANFLLIHLAGRDGGEVYNGLLDRGVIVRPMAGYGLPQTIRVTIGLPEENDIFFKALMEIL
ncbi:MAG: histidinol-phosphate transaminase [bacterium]|nr:MAG: histidinol-phosphate transaminase [bacterium]